jgi:hypothetical protein
MQEHEAQIDAGGPGHGGEIAKLLLKLAEQHVEDVRAAKEKV